MSRTVAARLLRVALDIFFERLEVTGDKRIPSKGAAILTSNHPSSVMDALVLIATIKRRIHFLAAARLFADPFRSFLLRAAGAIPVYREADAPSKLRRNVLAFEECRRLLQSGRVIGIFPEGTTHSDPQVHALKRGTARIALEVESRHNFRMGLRVFPVGLNYRDPGRFRSRCLVVVGEPIQLSSYRERYHANRRDAERQLTDEIKANLQEHTLHVKKLRLAELVKEVEDIYRGELMDRLPPRIAAFREPERGLELSKAIIRAIEYFDDNDPDRVQRLWESIRQYKRCLRWIGLSDEAFEVSPKHRRSEPITPSTIAAIVLGFPVALYGLVNNIIPYLVPLSLCCSRNRNPGQLACVKFFMGCCSFMIFYALQGTLCALIFGPWAFLAYVFTLPLSGLFTMRYFRRLRAVGAHLRLASVLLRSKTVVFRLARIRERLIEELDAAKADYMEFLAKGGQAAAKSER